MPPECHLLAPCRKAEEIPWGSVGADYVVESTGVFTTIDKVRTATLTYTTIKKSSRNFGGIYDEELYLCHLHIVLLLPQGC